MGVRQLSGQANGACSLISYQKKKHYGPVTVLVVGSLRSKREEAWPQGQIGLQKVRLGHELLPAAILTEGSIFRPPARFWGYCGQEEVLSKEVMFAPTAEIQGKASHTVLGREHAEEGSYEQSTRSSQSRREGMAGHSRGGE